MYISIVLNIESLRACVCSKTLSDWLTIDPA